MQVKMVPYILVMRVRFLAMICTPAASVATPTVSRTYNTKELRDLPHPEVFLYGPPVITSGAETAGSLQLNLDDLQAENLCEVSIKLEASVLTWSPSEPVSAEHQKKRLYVERQPLWTSGGRRSNLEDMSSGSNKWEFTFAVPPDHLPPSFRYNAHICIRYTLKATAHFTHGSSRTCLNLEYNPMQVVPDEQWGLVSGQNWVTIGSAAKFHPQKPSHRLSASKLGPADQQPQCPVPRLALKDKLRGRSIYPLRLEAMYLESGVYANEVISPLHISVLRDQLPLPELVIGSVQVTLNIITRVAVRKRKYAYKSSLLLIDKRIHKRLPGELSVDLTRAIGPVTLPNVDPSFLTKTLARSYELDIQCEIVSDDCPNVVKATVPLTVYSNCDENMLPPYYEDAELPDYSESE